MITHVNEQELTLRVGDLASRIGYPMPAIIRTANKKRRDWISLELAGAVGPTLYVDPCVDESLPTHVRDFLIAQELVQSRLGAHRHRRWLRGCVNVLWFLIGAGVAIGLHPVVEPLWLAVVVMVPVVYVLGTCMQILVFGTWSRLVIRRSDQQLIQLFGRPQVVDVLRWLAGTGWRRSVRWLLAGAPMTLQERLRRLDRSGTD